MLLAELELVIEVIIFINIITKIDILKLLHCRNRLIVIVCRLKRPHITSRSAFQEELCKIVYRLTINTDCTFTSLCAVKRVCTDKDFMVHSSAKLNRDSCNMY